jgi:large subunit ribosomal protein L6
VSRVGRKIIEVPSGVKVQVNERELEVQGPKGKLQTPVPPGIKFALDGSKLSCQRASDERQLRAFHGMARALAQNAIKGVTEGFSKELDIVGVGYRAAVEGNKVVFALGFSHPVEYKVPRGSRSRSTSRRASRSRASTARRSVRWRPRSAGLRRPDPYKQKGIRYVGRAAQEEGGQGGATGAK